jgi:mannose-6-phosphate isomerase-like protein (cupin superfamily)
MTELSPSDSHDRLATLGVEFHTTTNDDVPDALLADVLPEGEQHERAVATMEPPKSGAEYEGVGAWHVNAQDEAHFLRSGTGQVQFVDNAGIITVNLSAGDVMIIRRVEHRFRALTPCTWVLHYSGPDGADLETTPTGRANTPWA